MFFKAGDVITFIQEEEEEEDDIFLKLYQNRHPSFKKEYLEWKEFLAENGIGIYIYGREALLGIGTFNLLAIYFDQNALFGDL